MGTGWDNITGPCSTGRAPDNKQAEEGQPGGLAPAEGAPQRASPGHCGEAWPPLLSLCFINRHRQDISRQAAASDQSQTLRVPLSLTRGRGFRLPVFTEILTMPQGRVVQEEGGRSQAHSDVASDLQWSRRAVRCAALRADAWEGRACSSAPSSHTPGLSRDLGVRSRRRVPEVRRKQLLTYMEMLS